jgi:hypothetical protein
MERLSEYEELRQVAEKAVKAFKAWTDSEKVEVGGQVVEDEEAANEIREENLYEALGFLRLILEEHEEASQRRLGTNV